MEYLANIKSLGQPISISIMSKWFNLFVTVSNIPHIFGASYIYCSNSITCRSYKSTDFRGISISPTISKLLGMAIVNRSASYFGTSEHQFENQGCREALFCVRNVVETVIAGGSTVSVCALDL